jgi:DNA-binding Lrp family transcriptional regulator
MQEIFEALPKRETAYVMITCESGCEYSVLEELKEKTGISEIEWTFGSYDLILKIETESIEHLRELISKKIRSTQGIIATTTLMCTGSISPMLIQSAY